MITIFIIGGASLFSEFNHMTKSIMVVYETKLPKNPTIENKLKTLFSAFESEFSNVIFKKELFVEGYGLIQKNIGKLVVNDIDPLKTVYLDNNGFLQWVYPKINTSPYIKKVVKFNKMLKVKKIPMLFVLAPFKNIKGYTKLPISIRDYSNENSDEFIAGLQSNGVSWLDLRAKLEKDHLNKAELFYKTDHHWKSKTGFWAYQTTLPYINKVLGRKTISMNVDINNFKVQELPQSYSGSQGTRVGKLYGGVDDFELMTPSFKTDYEAKYYLSSNKIVYKKGSFEDALIQKKYLDPLASVYTNRYSSYLGGLYPQIDITNKIGKGSLLIIQDSFGNGVYSPFLSLNFHKTTIVDLRLFNNKPLSKLIDNQHYDMVIILYNPSCFTVNATKKFNLR